MLAVRRAVRDDGPHVSLDRVAAQLGVTAPALFRRFRSRNDLLLAALRPEEVPPVVAYLDAGPDERPAEEQLVEVCTRLASYLATTLPCIVALRESGIPLEQINATFSEPPPLRTGRALAGWLARAQTRGLFVVEDPSATAMMVLGALQAPIFFRHLAKQTDPWDAAHFARALTRVLLGGIGASGTARAARASSLRSVSTKERS